MNYGDLIRDAIRITRHNRYLWFFGFFVGLGSGGGSGGSGGGGGGDFDEQSSAEIASVSTFALQWGPFDNALLIVALVVLVLLIFLVFFALYVVSQGGLTESVAAIERGEERRFSSTWRAGLSHFWRVVGQVTILSLIWLGITLAISLLGALLAVGTFAATDSVTVRVLVVAFEVILFLPLLFAFFVSLTIVGQFGLRALVVGGEGVIASIGSGYRLFRRNMGSSLLLLIQIGIALGVGAAMFAVLTAAGLLVSILVTILSSSGQDVASAVVAVVLGVILSLPFIVLASAVGVFHQAYWTLAYLRLTEHPEGTEPAQQASAA